MDYIIWHLHSIRIFYDENVRKQQLVYMYLFICLNGLINGIRTAAAVIKIVKK